jgi:hypothetical protein
MPGNDARRAEARAFRLKGWQPANPLHCRLRDPGHPVGLERRIARERSVEPCVMLSEAPGGRLHGEMLIEALAECTGCTSRRGRTGIAPAAGGGMAASNPPRLCQVCDSRTSGSRDATWMGHARFRRLLPKRHNTL